MPETPLIMFPKPLEIWGGLECTVNRVGNDFFDHIQWTGHETRLGDLELFAELGLRTLRYPVLWERTAPAGLQNIDWTWSDMRLRLLQHLNIAPVVGLLHHGSGPRYTSLMDPEFPEKLAAYAGAVAERYPWITAYTPINEPLTTARFSGLYGHWYPHGRDERTFARTLLNQCRAIILAMQSIRRVNPAARWIQTEDVGKTYSTPLLAYQADFENERRWLSLDLLCGRVVRGSRMRGHLHGLGISNREMDWFEEHACPPDILGLDYYPTSDRFLDEHFEAYPAATWGGNGKHSYADVEAVRVRPEGISGVSRLLHELWERYGLPLAVTEAHLGGTSDEQVRWLAEVWQQAQQARQDGVPVVSVTAWALLGLFDWDSLVTQPQGHYEPGVFQLRTGLPCPTPLTDFVRTLAAGRPCAHAALSQPGWWNRPERLLYPAAPQTRAEQTCGEQISLVPTLSR